jgi:hypothetical protein
MTNILMNRKTLFTAAIMAVGAIGFSSLGAQASSTSSLAQCKAFSREKVVKCCDTVLKQQGAPAWFRESNMSCSSAVSCTGGGYDKASYSVAISDKYRCWIQMYEYNNQGKQQDNENRGRQSEGKN